MADTTDRRIIEIDVRTARNMQAEIKRAADSLGGLEKTIGSMKGVIADFAAGFAGAFTVGAFVEGIRSSIEAMDQMGKRAQQIGMTTEALSALTFQAQLSGVAAQELDVGLVHLNKGLADLGKESSATTKALEQLGVVAGTDTEQALEQIAEQFSQLADSPEKTALAVDIFGKSGAKLIPLLNEGAEGLEKFRKEAERLGIIVSKESAAAAELFNDNLARLQAGVRGTMLQLTQGLVPALTQVTNALEGSTESGERFKDFGEGLGEIVKFVTKVFLGLSAVVQTVGRGIAAFAAATQAVLEFRFGGISTIFDEFKTDVASIAEDAGRAMAKLDEAVDVPVKKGGIKKLATDVKVLADELKRLEQLTGRAAAKQWADDLELVTNKFFDGKISVQEYDNALKKITGTSAGLSEETKKLIKDQERLDQLTGRAAAKQLAADVELLDKALAEFARTGGEAGISADEYALALNKLLSTTTKTKDDMTELGKAIQQSIEGWSGAAADAILDFATGAERDIAKMVEGIIRQFAKMALQKMIFDNLFRSFGGFVGGAFSTGGGGSIAGPSANGNVFDPGGQVATFANGGIVTAPTVFGFANGGVGVMGEAGPEAIMPLSRNAQGKLGVEGGGVNVTVINQAGAEVDVQTSRNANGERDIQVFIQKAVTDGLARGRFDGVMGATYGLSRRGH